MINTIVFDMGGVIVDYKPERYVKKYTELSEEERQYLLEEIFLGEGWVHLDYGFYDDEEYIKILEKKMPEKYHKYIEEILRTWYKNLFFVEGTTELIAELKAKGYKIYLLSNAGLAHNVYWPTVPASRYFDGVLVSANEKKWKPNADFYELLFERFELDPGKCLFVDNLEENLVTSRAVGMDCVLFTDAAALRKDLERKNLL